MKKFFIFLVMMLAASLLNQPTVMAQAKQDTTKSKKESKHKKTDYEKLFEDKKVETVKGLITLHKMGGKVYFEFPKDLIGKYMLVGSVVQSTSNFKDAAAGEQPNPPLPVYFTMEDSTVQMRKASFVKKRGGKNHNFAQAFKHSTIGPILASFPIKAMSPDSSAYVFNATKFFVNGNKAIDPFGPYGGSLTISSSHFKRNLSFLDDIKAYADNITVTSYLSFTVSTKNPLFGFSVDKDRKATYLMNRSLVLLPDKPARPRINDPRIGIFNTQRTVFKPDENGTKKVNYAHRWNLQPKDTAAFKAGKLAEPVKPITFYIDDHFPDKWVQYIKAGTKDWNKAFREIGYKHAIVTKMYPENDSTFDPNNLKFNTIKYVSTPKQNSMGPSWVDPRSGEILSANVYIYHGITDLLNDWIFKQTAAADKRVRSPKVPDPVIGRALRYVVAHEVGHTLGLMHNMAASSAFPTDSLRSPSFTQKYGTTPSIMDYARFNSVAQPGDLEQGVQMRPPHVGVYDKYVIKWLYTPIFSADTPQEEVPILDRWITQKIKDPKYRYGKQQLGVIDPSAQTEDLGDDLIKTAEYTYDNYKFILNHLNDWVKDEDRDLSFRTQMQFSFPNIYAYWPMHRLIFNIGGVYEYEVYETDQKPAYKVVPESLQHRTAMFVLNTIEDLSWLNNSTINRHSNNIVDKPAQFLRRYFIAYLVRICPIKLAFSESKTSGDTYTRQEFMEDVFNYIWGPTMDGKSISNPRQQMQQALTDELLRQSPLKKMPAPDPFALTSDYKSGAPESLLWTNQVNNGKLRPMGLQPLSPFGQNELKAMGQLDPSVNPAGQVSGFGYFGGVPYVHANMDHLYYRYLLQTKHILEQAVKTATGEQKTRYQYMLIKVKRALEEH